MIRQKELNILLELFFTLNALRNICLFLSLSGVASILFYITYGTLALIIILASLVRIKKRILVTKYFLASAVLIALLIGIPCAYGASAWTANSYTSVSFLMTILFLIFTKNVRISNKTIKFCYITFVLQAVFAIGCSFSATSFNDGVLELHIGNPNQTAILLWSIFAVCFLYWSKNRSNKRGSMCLGILIISLMILILLTESRTGLFSCMICFGGYFWINRKYTTKTIPYLVQGILLTMPIFFPLLILFLINILPNEITIFGKLLFSGREQIWKNILEAFLNNPFATHLNESPYYSNVIQNDIVSVKAWGSHNGLLAVQWNYGIVVTILAIYILGVQIIDLKRSAENHKNSCVVYIVLLATIFSISFEEGLLMGNVCTTATLVMLFIIGRSEEYNYIYNDKEKDMSR